MSSVKVLQDYTQQLTLFFTHPSFRWTHLQAEEETVDSRYILCQARHICMWKWTEAIKRL